MRQIFFSLIYNYDTCSSLLTFMPISFWLVRFSGSSSRVHDCVKQCLDLMFVYFQA